MFCPPVKTSCPPAENVEVLVFFSLSLFDASIAVYNITNKIPDLSYFFKLHSVSTCSIFFSGDRAFSRVVDYIMELHCAETGHTHN